MGGDIYIIGVGMIKFGKFLERSVKDMTGLVLDAVLKDCDLTRDNIQAAYFSNCLWGLYSFQHCVRGQVALTSNGLQGVPVTNVENACASGSTALNNAWIGIKSGLYDCSLAIGVEKQYDEDRGKVMGAFIGATDVEAGRERAARAREQVPQGREPAAGKEQEQIPQQRADGHSAFMDGYAAGARHHMERYGTTQRQLAIIAAKNHNNSVLNPLAQYTFPQTVEQVLNDYVVAYPLTRAMCAPIGDGAAAAIVCSEAFLKKHPTNRAVRIRASMLDGAGQKGECGLHERVARKAFDMAGVGPEDIDVMEVHDASAMGEISVMESFGFCAPGEGGLMAEKGDTALDGKLPLNPSGGLISRGHPIGASGLAQIFELVTQLRGEAGKRQVKNPRLAMTENGGGTTGIGQAALTSHILERI